MTYLTKNGSGDTADGGDGQEPIKGEYKGPRVVTTRNKDHSDYVQSNGADFPKGTPKGDRKAGGHIHGQTK